MKHRRRLPFAVLAFVACTGLLAPGSIAHPRAYRHTHQRPLEAVIVVGDPSPARRAAAVTGAPRGVLDLNVKPKTTEIWIDGNFRGSCDDFDGHPGKLHLPAGLHDVKLVLPDGVTVERQVRVRAGVEVNVGLDLR